MKYINYALLLIILTGCSLAMPFYDKASFEIKDRGYIAFSPEKTIYVESDSEVVKLSSTLKQNMINEGFKLSRHKRDSDYVLEFNYDARLNSTPWVFEFFNVTVKDRENGDVLYSAVMDKLSSEPVQSVMKRIAQDMNKRLTSAKKMPEDDLIIAQAKQPVKAVPGLVDVPFMLIIADPTPTETTQVMSKHETSVQPQQMYADISKSPVSDARRDPLTVEEKDMFEQYEVASLSPDVEQYIPDPIIEVEPVKVTVEKEVMEKTEAIVPDSKYFIQAGSWKRLNAALSVAERLKGIYSEIYVVYQNNFHKVRIAGIENWSDGKAMIDDIEKNFRLKPLLVVNKARVADRD
ncbi:MAG: hypothetical protein ISR96_11350 [Nitrospira sp.]|nr:hypothetical protein [Nitrospira sp.]